MTFVSQAPLRRNSHLIPAGLAMLVAGLICVLHLRLFGQSWPMLWLPVAIVALWPSRAGPVGSGVMLILAGLWIDFVTLGAPGQWPLVLLIVYAVLRPDTAEPVSGLIASWLRVAIAGTIAVGVFIVSGRLVYGVWPDMGAIGRGVAVLMFAAPIIIVLRAAISRWVSGDDY